MNGKKIGTMVSHEDVQRAVQRFLKDGGIIVRLPEQQGAERPMVGGEKYQDFETLNNLVSK